MKKHFFSTLIILCVISLPLSAQDLPALEQADTLISQNKVNEAAELLDAHLQRTPNRMICFGDLPGLKYCLVNR